MFISQLVISAVLICITVIIHGFALDRLFVLLDSLGPKVFRLFRRVWKAPMLVIAVLGTFLAHVTEMWLWAIFYLQVGALSTLEEALYFSTSTFTTVGFGDIVLDDKWRLISSFQSANGFILFGWSTAFIFEVTSRLYKSEAIRKTEKA